VPWLREFFALTTPPLLPMATAAAIVATTAAALALVLRWTQAATAEGTANAKPEEADDAQRP
jgi:hypothetical protein